MNRETEKQLRKYDFLENSELLTRKNAAACVSTALANLTEELSNFPEENKKHYLLPELSPIPYTAATELVQYLVDITNKDIIDSDAYYFYFQKLDELLNDLYPSPSDCFDDNILNKEILSIQKEGELEEKRSYWGKHIISETSKLKEYLSANDIERLNSARTNIQCMEFLT